MSCSELENSEEDEELFKACRCGDLETVKSLGSSGSIPDVRNHSLLWTGDSLLHHAAWNGHLHVVQYLVTVARHEVGAKNVLGDVPLHPACRFGHINVIKFLINEAQCDPNARSNHGWTPLHYACMSGELEVVKYLVNEAHCDPKVASNDGWTSFHFACMWGRVDVLTWLQKNTNCDPNLRIKYGWSPLHIAQRHKRREVIVCMAKDDDLNPNIADNNGETPLHIACRRGEVDIVNLLLTQCNADPNCTSSNGSTPLFVTESTPVIKLLLEYGAKPPKVVMSGTTPPGNTGGAEKRAKSTINLFMVGDKGSGKSTLTKALIKKTGTVNRWIGQLSKVSGVKEKTAGIECYTVHSSRIGNLTIHDLAGHREFHSSHDTVIRNCISGPSSGIFLLVADLNAFVDDLKRAVSYWLSFIQSQVSEDSVTTPSKPYLLSVGSHSDLVKSKKELKEKQLIICSLCNNAKNVNFVDYVKADCRYSESPSLNQLRLQILKTHNKLQGAMPKMTSQATYFHIFLLSEFGKEPGVQLGELLKSINNPSSYKKYYLHLSSEVLHEMCSLMNNRGIMLYIQTDSVENSWIVIDRDRLLREVNGSVFAPSDFIEREVLTRTGVVPFTKICSTFKGFDPQLIVDFLAHMEFCQEIREEDLLNLVTVAHTEYNKERHFLFPALTEQCPPRNLWKPHPHQYTSCWVLRCLEDHYLSPRFHQVLLLRLAFLHAEPLESHMVAPTSPVLHQQCSIWRSGIKWTTDSCDVLVEITDHSVVLFLSCRSEVSKKGKELELVATRSQVISQVLMAKAKFCGSVKTVEEFVPDPQYLLENTHASNVSLVKLAYAICSNRDNVQTSPHNLTSISNLLYFEPLKFCNSQCLVDLYCKQLTPCKVTQDFIQSVSSTISCVDDFCRLLKVPLHKIDSSASDYHRALAMFQEWQSQSEGTYQCLREHFDPCSVFSGRNILDIANIPVYMLPSPTGSLQPASCELDTTVSDHDADDFEKISQSMCPDLTTLLSFPTSQGYINLSEEIGGSYKAFGALLLKDKSGAIMSGLEKTHNSRAVDITYDVFVKWITECASPLTWETFVNTLRRAGLYSLASVVERGLTE